MRRKTLSGLCAAMFAVCLLFAGNLYAGTISGDVYYPGEPKISGPLHIVLSTSNVVGSGGVKLDKALYNFDPYSALYHYSITLSTSFTDGSYYVFAFVDGDGDGGFDSGQEPSGLNATQITVSANNSTDSPYIRIENPGSMSLLKINSPENGKYSYYGDSVWVDAEADYGGSGQYVSKIEFYVNNSLKQTRTNTSMKPFHTSWDYWPIALDAGTQKTIMVKSYRYDGGTEVMIDSRAVAVSITSQQVTKINGQVQYSGDVSSWSNGDNLYILTYNGFNGPVVSTKTYTWPFTWPKDFTAENLPNSSSLYVKAIMDRGNNGFTGDPSSTLNGPYTISTSSGIYTQWGAYLTLNDTSTVVTYRIEGQVGYTATTQLAGPLHINVYNGQANFLSKTKMSGKEKIIYGPVYPSFYTFEGLSTGTYFVDAFIDTNQNNVYDSPGGVNPPDPYGTPGAAIVLSGQNMYMPIFSVINPTGTVLIPTEISTLTGTNSVAGTITYPTGTAFGDRIVIRVYDEYNSWKTYNTEIYGLGSYKVNNIPNLAYARVEAFIDYNWNNTPDFTEPQAKSSIFSLTGAATGKDLALAKSEIQKTTIKVTIRGQVYGSENQSAALSGALVRMYDTGGFEDWMPENDVFVASATTTGWKWVGANKYNFEISSVTVYVKDSNDGGWPWYNYTFKISNKNYRLEQRNEAFNKSENNTVRTMDIMMQPKPQVTISNLTVSPTTISPDNDGTDDRAKFTFKYSVQSTMRDWNIGAQAKLVIDTNSDNIYTPMEWGMFVYIDGKEFIKKKTHATDATIQNTVYPEGYVDYMNPNYTKTNTAYNAWLDGPLTWEQRDKYSSKFDATMDWWIDAWQLEQGQDSNGNSIYSKDIEMVWEGRDNRWQALPNNAAYKWKLILDDPGQFDVQDGIIYSSTGTIGVRTASIKGIVKDSSGAAIEGARVNAGGPGAWGEAFSDASGNFEISGLRVSKGSYEGYYFRAEKTGYVAEETQNVIIPADPGYYQFANPIVLSKGIKVAGTITIPNPPTRGSLRDQWGNQLWDLWGNVESWRTDGPGWYQSEVRVALKDSYTAGEKLSVAYEIWLEPGNFEMQVRIPGYVSTTETVTVGTTDITNKNITLTKSAVLTGTLKLPITAGNLSDVLADARRKGFWNNLWINMNAETKDRKNHSYTGVNFDFWELGQPGATFSKDFRFDTLIPGTSYTISIESNGMFAQKKITVFVPATGEKAYGEIGLGFGAAIKGTIKIVDNVSDKIESAKWGGYSGDMLPAEMQNKVPIFLDVRNTQSYTWHGMDIWISSTTFPGTYEYTIKGLSSGRHEIGVNGIRGVDIDPPLTQRYVMVSTETHSATTPAEAPTIYVKKPSGILVGTIKNSSGRTINWNRVDVLVASIGDEGGDPAPAKTVSGSGDSGTFRAENLLTGDMIVWGTEYRVKPYETENGSRADFFGYPSGNAGMFMKVINTQSGGVTTYCTVELLPPATIYVNITGSAEMVAEVLAKTTTYTSTEYGPRPSICKVQPITLRKLAELMEESGGDGKGKQEGDEFKEDDYGGKDAREIALSGELVGSISDYVGKSTVTFKMCGLSEGIYFAYPLVNYKFYVGMDESSMYPKPIFMKYDYASAPMEKYVVLQANSVAETSFTLGTGVTVEGSITRPSGNYRSPQTVNLSLRSPVTNEAKYTQTITFSTDTTKRTNTLSFKFTKVSPSASGKYIFTAQALEGGTLIFKVHSETLSLTEASGTKNLGAIQLSKGATLTGKIADESGNGISENVLVECEAYPYVEGSYMNTDMFGVKLATESATKGTFTFPNLPGGTYKVKVSMKSGAKVNLVTKIKAGITVPDSNTQVDIGVITLKNATSIKGLVKNSSGKPLGNVSIIAQPQDAQKRQNMFLETATDKDGAFIINGVDPSIDYWIVQINKRKDLEHAGDKLTAISSTIQQAAGGVNASVRYGSVVKIVDIGKNNNAGTITLPVADAVLNGKILTPDNSQLILPFPIEGLMTEDYPAALILIQSLSDLSSGDPMSGVKMVTKGTGDFSIDGIVAGDYTIKVFAKRFATHVSTVSIKSGTNTLPNITMEKGATVTGNIRTQTGAKISKNDASIVLAASKDFKKVVFGSLTANPSTLEVDNYEIVGLEPGIKYYLTLVQPEMGKVFVDHKSTVAAAAVGGVYDYIVHPITYRRLPPMFEAKAYKLNMSGLFIKGGTASVGAATYEVPNMLEVIFNVDLSGVDFSSIQTDKTYEFYIVFAYATQALTEDTVSKVVAGVNTTGLLIPMIMSDDRKGVLFAYIPSDAETASGTFSLKFTGQNSEGIKGSDTYIFYIGEDGRSEKLVNPMIGGNLSVGEGDATGIEVPSGLDVADDPSTPAIDEGEVSLSSGTRISVVKVTDVTASQTGSIKYGPRKYSPKAFSLKKVPSADTYPGTLYSDLYDMQVRLISGPLASLAGNSSVGVSIQISSMARTEVPVSEEDNIGMYHFDNNVWTKIEGATIDWENLLVSANANSFSTFAIFYAPGSGVAASSVTAVAANLSDVQVYPNPYKSGVANYNGADGFAGLISFRHLTARAKIKIFNIAGELVYEELKDDATNGSWSWDMKNKDGNKLASGIYIYYITNPDVSGDKAKGKLGIIK